MSAVIEERVHPAGDEVVRGESLRCVYHRGSEEVVAIDGVSVAVHSGELVALVGPSGSGKTTLLNLIAGWEEPEAGQLRWRGGTEDHAALPWSELAIVPQGLGVLDELTVIENVRLPLRVGPGSAKERQDVLGLLGLTEFVDRHPDELSLGQRQRVAIARALILAPRLLLADEPTGHQDAEWTPGVVEALHSACKQLGTAALVATHDPEVLEHVDRTIELRDGRLVTSGVYEHP
ncbi:MAG: ATP-binding cassette domain-containing protein [Nitriliruptorales bacterium]|nr:ATP-binding cassette domain-containing protein [Nitriliruptorales bacterium]